MASFLFLPAKPLPLNPREGTSLQYTTKIRYNGFLNKAVQYQRWYDLKLKSLANSKCSPNHGDCILILRKWKLNPTLKHTIHLQHQCGSQTPAQMLPLHLMKFYDILIIYAHFSNVSNICFSTNLRSMKMKARNFHFNIRKKQSNSPFAVLYWQPSVVQQLTRSLRDVQGLRHN